MYVIDLTHDLDAKAAIAPERGPARKMAVFITSVIAHASDFDRPEGTPGPVFCALSLGAARLHLASVSVFVGIEAPQANGYLQRYQHSHRVHQPFPVRSCATRRGRIDSK